MTGFVLSVVLTAIPFLLVMTRPIPSAGYTAAIVLACALVQILVHMIYFLHMTPKAEGGWLLLSTVFTIVLRGDHAGGVALDRVPSQPEHDAGDGRDAGMTRGAARRDVRRGPRRAGAGAVRSLVLAIAGFVALGVWQVERRAWKHDLIARVDARVAAAPVAPPAPADWPRVPGARRLSHTSGVTGRFLHDPRRRSRR